MAGQKIQQQTPSRTAASQRLPASKDKQRKVNTTRRLGVPHTLNIDERLRLARERREERERQLLSKKVEWQLREERARRYYEKQLEERKRRQLEQRSREEGRRHAAEEKRMQKMKEEKERHENAVRRTLEKSQRAKQSLSQGSRGRTLTKNNGPCRLPLSTWEKNLVNRLRTPTCSYLSRSKSAGCQSQEEVVHVCRRSVSCHSMKATATPHKAQYLSGPADLRITSSPMYSRTQHHSGPADPRTTRSPMYSRTQHHSGPADPRTTSSSMYSRTQHHSGPADPRTTSAPSRTIQRTVNLAQFVMKMKAEQTEENKRKLCNGGPPQTADANSRVGSSINPPNRPNAPPPKRSRSKYVIRHFTPKQMGLAIVPEEDVPDSPSSLSPGNSEAVTAPADYYQEPVDESALVNPYPDAPQPQTPAAGGEPPPPGVTSRPMAGTTDPAEASRLLAEKRREARQQREREEEERLQREEAERRVSQELEGRRAEERARREAEAQRLIEERKRREEEDQKLARAEIAHKAMEEAALLQREREEELARQREKAEQLRLEREKVFQREEAERQARKKRLEDIMRRTRKSDPVDKKPPSIENLVNEAQPKENTEHGQNGTIEGVIKLPLGTKPCQLGLPAVEDMVPVVAFKERRTLRTLSGLEEIQAHQRAEVI